MVTAAHSTAVRARRIATGAALYLVAAAVAFISVIPFLWMVDTSIKPEGQALVHPPVIVPDPATLENFREVFRQINFLLFFRNTLWYSLWVVIGQLITCSLAGYAFARLHFPGRDTIFYLYLGTMMIPIWVVIIPLFMEMRFFGWANTMWAMTIPGMFGSAFGTFLLRQFFMTLPADLDDAALIDGANKLQIYLTIILPLSKSALTVLAVFTLLAVWNDFIWPLIMLNNEELWTLTLGLRWFQGHYGTRWTLVMAAAVMAVAPVLLVFTLAQRYFVRTISFTGLAGR